MATGQANPFIYQHDWCWGCNKLVLVIPGVNLCELCDDAMPSSWDVPPSSPLSTAMLDSCCSFHRESVEIIGSE